MTDETTETPKKVTYCDGCGRIEGIGCSCGVPFRDRIKGIAATVPDHMRAVPRRR